jgi:hypothetical protein
VQAFLEVAPQSLLMARKLIAKQSSSEVVANTWRDTPLSVLNYVTGSVEAGQMYSRGYVAGKGCLCGLGEIRICRVARPKLCAGNNTTIDI